MSNRHHPAGLALVLGTFLIGGSLVGCNRADTAKPAIPAVTAQGLLNPAVFRCQADCIRPDATEHQIDYRFCANNQADAEFEAGVECANWKMDAVVVWAQCEEVRPPAYCMDPGHENDCDCNPQNECILPNGNGCGDPHMVTMDGVHYEFQPVGEFVYATDNETFHVQMRTEQVPGLQVSVITALALRFSDGTKVAIAGNEDPMLRVNDLPMQFDCVNDIKLPIGALCTGRLSLQNGASVHYNASSQSFVFDFPDGVSHVNASLGNWMHANYFNTQIFLGPELEARTVGLLGTANGRTNDDMMTRAGMILQQPVSFNDTYRVFGDSWRVQDTESLFFYQPGKSTASFTDGNFPLRPLTPPDLQPNDVNSALNKCVNAGVPVEYLQQCSLDVALGGSPTAFLNIKKF